METNVNYTIVGIFVITLISAVIMAILWLSSGLSFGRYRTYVVNMEESVSGLNPDSQVEFNGVNVGTVRSIELNPKNPEMVEVKVDIKSNTPITRGTVATLATRGLTGLAFVALKDSSNDLRPIIMRRGDEYPVIPTAPSIFMRIDKLLNKLSTSFEQIAASFTALFDEENLGSIKKTLTNIETVTNTLALHSTSLKGILVNTEKASKAFIPLIKSSRSAMQTLENQTLPTMYRLMGNMEDISANLTSVSEQMKQNPSVLIRGNPPAVPGPGERQ